MASQASMGGARDSQQQQQQQMMHRQNSQASSLNNNINNLLLQKEQQRNHAPHQVASLNSHRSNKANNNMPHPPHTAGVGGPKGTHETGGGNRSSIVAIKRRKQQPVAALTANSAANNNLEKTNPLVSSSTGIKDFTVHKKIGSGAYSEVFLVTRKSDGNEYALKQVKIQRLTDKEKFNALNEVRILASINNDNVIAYKDAFFDEVSSTLCIVMEFAGSGDLYEKIMNHQKSATEFQEAEIWDALVQMTAGLKALHDRKIFHRDLKSANIFQSQDGTYKMGDLNVSKIAQDGLLHTQTGTPYYASPEVWQEKPYDNKSDIWSLGCIIYEMCSLNPPFRAKSMNGLYNSVLSGQYPRLPQHISDELSSIIKTLLQVNPAKRPSCEQVLQHESIVRFINSQRSSFGANILQDNNKQPENILLSTIHCPRNLSQLSQILPRSKYQSGVDDAGVLINNQSNSNNVHFIELPAQIQAPSTAATAERKSKRRKNTSEATGDRNNIIEMAQQIHLPPIRESDNGNVPTILQQQQQRQQELLGLRRKTQAASNRSNKLTIESNNNATNNENRSRAAKLNQNKQSSIYTTTDCNEDTVQNMPHQSQVQQQQVNLAEHESLQLQKEKKSIKSQIQIRQQIGRVAQKEAKKQQQQQMNSHAQSTLASYPMDVANTLVAQNIQMHMETHSTSIIELPPSIQNIYATNDVVSNNNNISRFNHQQNNGSILSNRDDLQNHLQQQYQQQPITINDLSKKQRQQQMNGGGLQRNNSMHRGIEVLSSCGSRQTNNNLLLNQQQVYASQSNLVTTTGSNNKQKSSASAHRYQSVGMANHHQSSHQDLGGISTSAVSTNQQATQAATAKVTHTANGGGTQLPGLKLNLQTMKSAKQLQKFTPGDQLMNSMKMRQSVKQVVALATAQQQQMEQQSRSSNSNLQVIKETSKNKLMADQQPNPPQTTQQQSNKHQSTKLPPRQHSTTRNGGTNRSQAASKIINNKSGGGNANLSQRMLTKKYGHTSSLPRELPHPQNSNQSPRINANPMMKMMMGESQQTPSHLQRQSHNEKLSPPMLKKQTYQTSSQKMLKEADVMISQSSTNLLKSGIGKGCQKAIITNSESMKRNDVITGADDGSISHLQQRKIEMAMSAQQQPHITQTQKSNKDKSQIMVELMPPQGNSGRASTKIKTGRNHYESFSQKMEQMTSEQESLRILHKQHQNITDSNTNNIEGLLHQSQAPVRHSYGATLENSRKFKEPNHKTQTQVQEKNFSATRENDKQTADNILQEKRSQLKQLRIQQQSILTKKARNQTLQGESPQQKSSNSHYHQYQTKAAKQKQDQQQNLQVSRSLLAANTSIGADEATGKNSFANQQTQLQLLPNLKSLIEDNQNYAQNNNNDYAKQRLTVDICKQHEAGVTAGGTGTPSATNLEKNRQYLEQLRNLASIRHQKKQVSKKTPAVISNNSSAQTKKNGGNKAAGLQMMAECSVSPLSSNRQQNSELYHPNPIQPFVARSSLPKLPGCQEGSRTLVNKNVYQQQSANNHHQNQNTSNNYDQAN